MLKLTRKLRIAVATVLVLAIGITIAVLHTNNRRVGRVLDSYGGVSVYDNGLLFFRSYGRHYATNGYYYGQKWQCVEFVKRFYYQALNHEMPDVWGHARDFFDDSLPDGGLNKRRGLVQYQNGSTNHPALNDLIVFNDTRYGHVAVITVLSTNWIEVVQQNIVAGPRARYSLVQSNGYYFITAPRRPAGWLRKSGRYPAER